MISNGNVIHNYASKELYEKMYAMGNTMYGQMTAGSYCYIGPQGIVHGTTLTILNCNRYYRNTDQMDGVVYLSSGLGGMSGAQPKAGEICKCIAVIAEVNEAALDKRLNQGWVKEKISEIPKVIARIKELKAAKQSSSIGYLGNIVDLWEALAEEKENLVELASDQTSLHNPYFGGYYPVQLSFARGERNDALRSAKIQGTGAPKSETTIGCHSQADCERHQILGLRKLLSAAVPKGGGRCVCGRKQAGIQVNSPSHLLIFVDIRPTSRQ